MTTDARLEDQIRAWLDQGGFPLEMRVARSVRRHGAASDQARTFTDPQEWKLREIDVVAYFDRNPEPSLHLVIECKTSRNKPWVVFCTERPIRLPRAAISQMPATPLATDFLEAVATDGVLTEMPPFDGRGRTGYAVATGLRKPRDGGDPAYAAVRSVTSAATAVAERIGQSGHSVVFPPVIVLDTPLISCHLPEEGEEPVLERADRILLWHPTGTGGLLPVNIITEDALDDLLRGTGAAADRLSTLAVERELGAP